MMKVNVLAGGSGGNCIALRSNNATILIDAGIAKTKIEKRLLEVGIRADQIDAIFITHAHADHTKGLPLANKYRIPVYASEGEWKSIEGVDDELRRVIEPGDDMHLLDDLWINAFQVHHDAYNPLGYSIDFIGNSPSDHVKVSVCLDTGHVGIEMLEAMMGSDIYIIEANHEPAMVEASDYPNSVKARILSDIGHLSNEQTADALARIVKGKGERIYLTHLSSNNNMPALAEMTVKQALREKGFEAGTHYEIEVI